MAVSRSRSPRQSADEDQFRDAVARFGTELAPRMRGDGRREDRLRLPVNKLMTQVGAMVGLKITVHDEVTLTDLRSRPDIAVDSPSGRVGYIELKAPGKGTPETWRPDKHDREQWNKLKALPNLVYTDGSSWALYRKGELVGDVAHLRGDLARAGARLTPADHNFEHLLRNFLFWRPEQPRTLHGVIAEVAPLCRLLRDQVSETMERERAQKGKRPFTTLAREWRNILFPVSADKKEEYGDKKEEHGDFADSYAQAVTFALLLARVDGVSFEGRSPTAIAEQLAKQHSLLGEALSILANSKWVGHLNVVDTLVRIIGNIDWSYVQLGDADTYAKLYETFLADYDPDLRRHSGTYYTPAPVARAMVCFVDEVLKTNLRKRRGFASDDVIVVDPAMGAGTFLAEVLENAADTLRKERSSPTIPASHLHELFANRLVGFELHAAPFAVAELRLHTALKSRYGVELPEDEPRFLTNALDNPDDLPLDFGQLYDVLKESREKANRVKRDVPVMVVIGNPPWREQARGAAPWIEQRRDPAKPLGPGVRPSLDEFRPPGQGRRAFNLSNMWTYFWRWATWKAFEANDPAGVVALITPSAYLASSSYAGMRRYLREVADEGWVIDLSPEDHRPDTSTRIFPSTQQPICIGVFVRSGSPKSDIPARVHYAAITGSQRQKFEKLSRLRPTDSSWQDCSNGWQAVFRPGNSEWEAYPGLGDLLPWQQTGTTSNRNWVWAPDQDTLRRRWEKLVHADVNVKAALFKETSDRKIRVSYPSRPGVPSGEHSIALEKDEAPRITRVAFRSFDRQFLINDRRVVDRHRPELWQVAGPNQIYVCEQHAHTFEEGIALVFSALVPNVDCFNNRGGRVLPLYRSPDAESPNCPPRLLAKLAQFIGTTVEPADLLAYIAAITAHSGYTRRFRRQLTTPGVRIPLTMDTRLWNRGVRIGREVLWLHTYGERCTDSAASRPRSAPLVSARRRPRYVVPVPTDKGRMPDRVEHDPNTETLVVGQDTPLVPAGRVHPVRREVWEYRVGGMQVVKKWFSYRQPIPRHRKRTSELDAINPRRWTAQFDDELLELLQVLDRCVALESRQNDLLERVCAGSLVTVADLEEEKVFPIPLAYRKPPRQDPALLPWA